MATNRYYGIRFPFTNVGADGFYIDLDSTHYKNVRSKLTHLIFTPKGIRYRNPDFGTNLMKYIFQPNDDITATDIKMEIQSSISKYITNITIKSIEVNQTERTIDVNIKYTIDEGAYLIDDEINITI